MPTYLVVYDLRKQGKDYETLFTAMKALGSCWHCLDSAWLITSKFSPFQIRDYLTKYMDGNDLLIVAKITGNAALYNLRLPEK